VLTALEHDVAFTNWSRERLTSLPAPKRLAGYGIGRLVRVRELRLLEVCDAFFTFKQSDVDLVGAAGVRTPGYRLSPWLQRPRDRRPSGAAGADVLFVGAFDRRQNQWGATWLLEKVWPRVRAAAPDARLVLAGGGAPDSLEDAAARADNVVMTGFVDDLADCYEPAACVVAPVLGGAGLRFKVPQAMLYGVPLVVTPLALEGMEAAPRDCFVAITDEPGAFADGIVTALRAGPAAERAARLAPEWVEREFSFQRSIDLVLDVHARGPQRR
ncbi:MAG: glycosyltransferase family 4 protein, partial [Actinomycetes bacterium]